MYIDFENLDYINFMRTRELQLPKRWYGGDFEVALANHFEFYLTQMRAKLTNTEIVSIRKLCDDLIAVLKTYHSGYPAKAFKKFNDVMSTLMKAPLKIYDKNWPQGEFTPTKDPLKLYRIRNIQNNSILTRRDIFHVPYKFRSKINTSRYSIAGFPCLYLATDLELCCEETKVSNFDDLRIASRYQLNRELDVNVMQINVIEMGVKPIYFFDYMVFQMTDTQRDYDGMSDADIEGVRNKDSYMRKSFNDLNLLDKEVQSNYLLWYPLISSCSYIRVNKQDPFASEYVIPQLLMQWIRDKSNANKLYGIRYFSCASDLASDKGFNYVFPTSGNKISDGIDYCNILSKSFKLTSPYYIHEFESIKYCEKFLEKNIEILHITD